MSLCSHTASCHTVPWVLWPSVFAVPSQTGTFQERPLLTNQALSLFSGQWEAVLHAMQSGLFWMPYSRCKINSNGSKTEQSRTYSRRLEVCTHCLPCDAYANIMWLWQSRGQPPRSILRRPDFPVGLWPGNKRINVTKWHI